MSKKEEVANDAAMFEDDQPAEEGGGIGELDFNVNDEYKAEPLIPKGSYNAVCTGVIFKPGKFCIEWDFCLHDNGGVMSDGETPVDGGHAIFRNWLPKPGDETEMTKSGKNTKRQSKINMLMDFQNALGVDMSTPAKITTALNEQHWIGVEATVDIDISEWQGRFRNDVNRCNKSRMY